MGPKVHPINIKRQMQKIDSINTRKLEIANLYRLLWAVLACLLEIEHIRAVL